MPDLTGFPALDVAIGLALLFFLLSTACSAINEAIAAVLGWRAKTLEDGLARMLGDPKQPKSLLMRLKSAVGLVERGPTQKAGTDDPLGDLTAKVLAHWSIAGLVRDPEARSRRRARPSYIPPDVVSLAVAEVVAQEADPQAIKPARPDGSPDETPWAVQDAK